MRSATLPSRLAAGWPAILLAVTALAFLPMANLPSFDVPKLAVLVLGGLAILVTVARRRPARSADGVLADPILALPLLLAAVAAVGAIVVWPRGSLVGPVTALASLAVARLAASTDEPARAVRLVARGVAVAAAASGAYAILQKAGLDFTPWAYRREVASTFGNPSFAAEFQAAALPLSLLLAASPGAWSLTPGASRIADRILGTAAALLAAAHLLLATSRIDFIAAVVGLGVGTCLLLHAHGRKKMATGLALSGVAAAALLATAFIATARGEGPAWLGRSDTLAVRVDVWKSTTDMVADAPLAVAGRSFVDRYPAWRSPDEYRTSLGRRVETPHDDFLEIAASLGVPGLVVALGILALLAGRVVGAARTHPVESAALGGTIAAVGVSALASSPLSHPATALLPAIAAGLVVALAPRPLRGWTLPARTADVAFAAALALAVWPGPVWRGLRSDGFLALGRTHLESGDAAQALSLLDAAAAVDPQAFDARFELGSLLRSNGQRDESIAALRSARDLRPGDFDCRVNLAYALRDAGRREEAVTLVEDSLGECSWHPLLLAARAIFALEGGRTAEALLDARRAAAGLPDEPRLRALRAETEIAADPSEGSRTAALDALHFLHQRGETRELGRSARSMLHRDAGLLGPLVTRARRLVSADPSAASAFVLAAAAAVKDDAGLLDDASDVLRQAGRTDEATVLLGRSLGVRAAEAYERGENAKALKLAGRAAERDPSPRHFLLVARAATRLGEHDAAVESVGAAVASGPVDPAEVRSDPVLSRLLPDRRLEDVLDRAARRNSENHSKTVPR